MERPRPESVLKLPLKAFKGHLTDSHGEIHGANQGEDLLAKIQQLED
ncbi:MAG: hypothetical protein RLZZ196_761 [Bacteroidota bacterium]|jgi:hypothetical protein